jgi:protein TonB
VSKAINNNIDELTEAGESGQCRVRFIVNKEGVVSDVEAITMKGTKLAEVAVNAIRKGPKWKPAQQNGRFVKAFREQPIQFKIEEQ